MRFFNYKLFNIESKEMAIQIKMSKKSPCKYYKYYNTQYIIRFTPMIYQEI